MWVVIAFLIWVATVAFITVPFWRGRVAAAVPATAAQADREQLLERRDDLLRELKDLEFDREMGKIEAADYQELRASTAAATAAVLGKLDEASAPAPLSRRQRRAAAKSQTNGIPQGLSRAEIEAEVEILITRARRHFAATWQCAACGRVMSDADKFCGSCGKPRP